MKKIIMYELMGLMKNGKAPKMIKVNDEITQGTILGKSNNNKFCQGTSSMLFEVNFDGKVINPENFYLMDINELN